jgi:hypothetical protein
MKRIFFIIGLIIILVLPVTSLSYGCRGNITAMLGEEFTLPVGKTVEINSESLVIKFVDVTADSRCPTGVECFWAGEAKCQLLIKSQQSETSVTFTQSGAGPAQVVFQQYTYSFTLQPYPVAGTDIADADYYLIMTVTK